MERLQLSPGKLIEICCNEVIQVSVNDTTVFLICTIGTRGIRATADLRLANHERRRVNKVGESGSDPRYTCQVLI